MKIYFLLMIALVAAGCGRSSKNIVYEKDTLKLKQDFLPGVASGPSPAIPLRERIQGVWTDGSDVNASFLVKGDTIVFIEQAPRRYEIKEDSIKIFYADSTHSAKLFFKKDTLVMNDGGEEGEIKYWRFKD